MSSSSRSSQEIAQVSEKASFSVSDSGKDIYKKIRFYYDAPLPQDESKLDKSEKLMLVGFPNGSPAPNYEAELQYSRADKKWIADIEVHVNTRDEFIVSSGVDKNNSLAERQKAEVVQRGYIALTNGKPHPWIYGNTNTPKGTLQEMLYKADGSLKNLTPDCKLQPGDRTVMVYLPPDYKPDRVPPYNLQITLDGKQYLEAMHMNTAFDNLIAAKKMEPTVVLFVSPYCGLPDSNKPGYGSVCPPGYSLEQRFKEYSCNPDFANKLSALAKHMSDRYNATDNPDNTTIWGFSMGALQAGYTALLHPQRFGNVVAQSMMAFNIPTQNGENWRDKITDHWTSATAPLPAKETHDEYLTQMLVNRRDIISNRDISPSSLNWYFTAGADEEKYDPAPDQGFANLVAATDKFASVLVERGHTVAEHRNGQEARHVLVVSPGGHNPLTCMESAPDAMKQIHPPTSPYIELVSSTAKILASAAMKTTELMTPAAISANSVATPVASSDAQAGNVSATQAESTQAQAAQPSYQSQTPKPFSK